MHEGAIGGWLSRNGAGCRSWRVGTRLLCRARYALPPALLVRRSTADPLAFRWRTTTRMRVGQMHSTDPIAAHMRCAVHIDMRHLVHGRIDIVDCPAGDDMV